MPDHGYTISSPSEPAAQVSLTLCCGCSLELSRIYSKNSAEVDITPAFGKITTACNVGQAKKGHGACLKSGQLVYARFHTHSIHCCRDMYFNSRLACLKSVSRTITMQGFILTANTAAKKLTLFLDSM